MISYEYIMQLADALRADQAPTVDTSGEIQATSYDNGRHIYSVSFQVSVFGEVTVKVHVQWGLMETLLLNRDHTMRCIADDGEAVHIVLTLPKQPGVEYTAVLFRSDLEALWQRVYSSYSPLPEDVSLEIFGPDCTTEGSGSCECIELLVERSTIVKELKLKAYIAYERGNEDEWIYVHALTPSQAKAIARGHEIFEDTDYTDIRVKRMPKLDKVFRVDSENAFLAYDRGEYRVAYREG